MSTNIVENNMSNDDKIEKIQKLIAEARTLVSELKPETNKELEYIAIIDDDLYCAEKDINRFLG